MSSDATSSFDSAIIRSVCANVFTVETVRVRSFFRPRISKWPAFGSYLTLLKLRSGNFRLGFWCLRIERCTSLAVFSIRFSVSDAIIPPRLRRPRTLQRVGQDRDHLLFLGLGEAEDLPQRDADVRDVRLDVRLLLLRLGQPLPMPQEDAETAAALLQGETQLLDDLGI